MYVRNAVRILIPGATILILVLGTLELSRPTFADTLFRGNRNLSTTLRHRRFLFTDSFLLLWKWRVG